MTYHVFVQTRKPFYAARVGGSVVVFDKETKEPLESCSPPKHWDMWTWRISEDRRRILLIKEEIIRWR